jgi:hypothetical protein
VTVSSNFARQFAGEIAALASISLITTRQFAQPDDFGRTWYPTSRGLALLEETLWTR